MKRLLLLALLVPTISFSQGKLKKAKESLKENSTTVSTTNSSSSTSRSSRRRTKKKNYNNRVFESLVAEIAFQATLGLAFGQAQVRDLNPYSYYYDNEGEYAAVLSKEGKRQLFRVGTNYLFNTINTFEFNANYKVFPILAIDASYARFSEKNIIRTEVLDVTSVMINYHRFREKNFTVWWGIGATYVGNEIDRLGFAYNLGTEIYPVKPISLHLSWKESFINNNDIGVFKSHIKYHIKKTAFYTGYHHFELGSETVSGFVLGLEYTF